MVESSTGVSISATDFVRFPLIPETMTDLRAVSAKG